VLARVLDALDPKSDGASRDWVSIYEESARLLYQEINYELEAANGLRFANNFKNVPWVKVPDFYVNMTTPQVITMEYVPGIKTNDIEGIVAAGIDRKDLARKSAESYLTQICRHGFFHCDPHPGNLACDAVNGGRLIYYDFGMMDELRPEVRTAPCQHLCLPVCHQKTPLTPSASPTHPLPQPKLTPSGQTGSGGSYFRDI
jgi:predicted unusual protein kinase regulating ubiquinone biosynthesis (AarF/ABC1/UbiB family)